MHPDYESQRPVRNTPKVFVGARIPEDMKRLVEVMAATEADTVSGIILEGLFRVVESRRSDPTYVVRATEVFEARIDALHKGVDDEGRSLREALDGLQDRGPTEQD